MINKKNMKIRTVTVNGRGQIVIPEDMRKDLGIEGDSTLVLIRRGEDILIKKETAVLGALVGD